MDNLENLLKITAQRLGTTPDELKKAAASGEMGKLLSGANAQDTEAMNKVLGDPEAAKKLLNSKEAQNLMKLFGGNK